jgi:hypothetical protein
MRPRLNLVLIVSCFGALFLICYAPALFRDHQFAYRDASEYYYWLNSRVQAAWDQGRLPLWEPEENAGMPLLGNPTAAVLYPGKVVFAILPYALGARAYILAHSALALLSMLVLMRSWGTSWTGSALSAMAYAFGGPVLFQYSNVIYLIGAAWLPLGLHAIDRWVRRGRRWGLFELALVLAMQILGGEPQAAYLLGVVSVGYAAGLAYSGDGSRKRADGHAEPARRAPRITLMAVAALVFWCLVCLGFARWLPRLRGSGDSAPTSLSMAWAPLAVIVAWLVVAMALLYDRRRRGCRYPLCAVWLGLAGAAILSAALTAAQLLPVVEFIQQTGRQQGRTHGVYRFVVNPARLVELAWPNCLGTPLQSNDYWGDLITTPGVGTTTWVPTHYVGGLTLALAASALAIRRGPPWSIWLTVIGCVGLLGSLGQCTSPIWITRAFSAMSSSGIARGWLPDIGPLDPIDVDAARRDGHLEDSDGSVYSLLTMVLPGFGQFRYPAKLFTLTALALAALAGVGWDRVVAGLGRRAAPVFLVLLMLTQITLAVVVFERTAIVALFRCSHASSIFGPLNAVAAYQAILLSLGQAAVVFGLGLVLVIFARRHPGWASAIALVLMASDLALANSRYILTVPQPVFEAKPEVVKVIEDAEQRDRSPGPFRIHRVRNWQPPSWAETSSPDRNAEIVRWDHDTLDPKHGIAYGLQYTYALGVGELTDYKTFFDTFYLSIQDNQAASNLGVELGARVVYFPRRAYDLWNTRYFIIPFDVRGWRDPARAFAPFLFQTNQIYPDPARFDRPDGTDMANEWVRTRDLRVLRNLAEHPRAWVVHDARATSRPNNPTRTRRSRTMQEMLYAPDPLWSDASLPVYDTRTLAWVTGDDMSAIRDFLSRQPTGASETVEVTYPTPEKAVLDVALDSPGIVILADVAYPGWELAIDGKFAPIYRVNGVMRGAAVASGHHRLIYTYSPLSFKIGCLVSIAGLAGLLFLALGCARRPALAVVLESDESRGCES